MHSESRGTFRAGVAQLAERQPSKLNVAGSNPVSRSTASPPGNASRTTRSAADRRADIAATGLRLRRALARTIPADPALAATVVGLSAAYRLGTAPVDPRGHVHDARSAVAYAAARMPATYAAIARAMAEAADRLPGFEPRDLVDAGAGSGAATWAATAVWPSLARLTLIDREPAALELGQRLATADGGEQLAGALWRTMTLGAGPVPAADLVTAAYLLGEVGVGEIAGVVAGLWAATGGMLVLVEPGSRAGFEGVRVARSALIAAGGRVAAPCPGDEACPIREPAWCHFLARLDRSPLQRRAKGAARSWEDEPFSYVAVSRDAPVPAPRVVLGRPRHRPGVVELRVCVNGRIEPRTFSRRDGPAWRAARGLDWGDMVPPTILDPPG
jgi:ribosomal protein RSM22 (predicted rRNA methylase)